MPYIKQADRERYDWNVKGIVDELPLDDMDAVGHLNYIFTTILAYAFRPEECNYAIHNAIIGVLECCKQEWYRRKVAPYEDQKIKENGDVT